MITSSSNQQMKNITALMKKAKERKSQNLFVVEGRKMFEEVPPEWLSKVYVSERFLEEPEAEQLLAGKTYELAKHPNQIFSREQLIEKIWGMDYDGFDRTVDVHIKRIRENIGHLPGFNVVTVRGLGYKVEVE